MKIRLNERLYKQPIAACFRRVRNGEKRAAVLHSLRHEVYVQGVAAGRAEVAP